MQSGPYHTLCHTRTLCSFYLSFVFKTFVSTPKNKEVFPQNSDLSSSRLIVSLRSVFTPSHLCTFALSLYFILPTPFALSHCSEPPSHTISHSSILHQETISLLQNRTSQNHIGYMLRSPISTDLCRILGTSMIPRMCFVKNALAIVNTTHNTYMVEEVIDEAVHGTFVKYIRNGSVKPYEFFNSPAAYQTESLAFSQHVQYLKTKGLAFKGDFQGMSNTRNYSYVQLVLTFSFSGGTCLLMDPQIMTASYVSLWYSNLDSNPICYRDTGLIFLDRNLSSTNATFPTQHIFKMFCNFFKLPKFLTCTVEGPLFTNKCPNTTREEGKISEISD